MAEVLEEQLWKHIQEEKQDDGYLQTSAAKVLMKILYTARMARFDLLRPVSFLAQLVTQLVTQPRPTRATSRLIIDARDEGQILTDLPFFMGSQIKRRSFAEFA